MINEWVMEIRGQWDYNTLPKTSVTLQNDNLISPVNLQSKPS